MIIGLGMDLVEIERVERLLGPRGERAIARLFTSGEAAYVRGRGHPMQHFAVRLAAKEAAFKALSGNELSRTVGWRDIEVESGADGRPRLLFHGAASRRAAELGVRRVWVTLTHSLTTAGAVVVLEGEPAP